MEFKKGNKVTIVNTKDFWEGKTGTVLYEEDPDVEVRVNFETEDGETKSVIQIFNKENLEMERENESLNEATLKEMIGLPYHVLCWKLYELMSSMNDENAYMHFIYVWPDGETKEQCEQDFNTKSEYEELLDLAERIYKGYHDDGLFIPNPEKEKEVIELAHEFDKKLGLEPITIYTKNGLYKEGLEEGKENMNESVNTKKVEDIIHRYVYLEDLDGKEIPSWNFASRIATAEDMEEGCVCMKAEELGYKVFGIEAPSFFRCVIAAKGVKAEDIEEEYADFFNRNEGDFLWQ